MADRSNLRVNGRRLWDAHMAIAEIGALPGGGSCRLALSDEDREARDLFVRWCKDAGCRVTVDAAGNIFALRPGRRDASPVVMGSHLDTQPHGGRFDGIFGVLAGLEVIRTLNDAGIETELPVAVVNWTNEEGVRFPGGLMGSMAFAEGERFSRMRQLSTDGCRFDEELARTGYAGGQAPGDFPMDAYFEAHIEQGPVLERNGETIGVVTAVQGLRWFEVTVTGADRHAGTTPMEARRDALTAAAEMLVALDALGREHAPDARVTVGRLVVEPNAPSTVPGLVTFMIDVRHPDVAILDAIEREIGERSRSVVRRRGVEIAIRRAMQMPPVAFDAACVGHVEAAVRRLGLPHRRMPSGALHDACPISALVPSAMIFVPSRDGISHNEAEWTEPERLEAGANVLLHAVLARIEEAARREART